MSDSTTSTRRQFLARIGLLGAAAALGPAALSGKNAARAQLLDPVTEPLLDEAAGPVLRRLARDTMRGLAVFVVPGPDEYSRQQEMSSETPGAIEAKTDEFMLKNLDELVPLPDELASPLAAALAQSTSELDLPIPDRLLEAEQDASTTLDDALQTFLQNDQTVPLSLLTAMLLNYLATSVDPESVAGRFPASPFANLDYGQKAEAFRRLQQDHAEIVALLDEDSPEPAKETLSGLLKYLAGALKMFPAFGAYSEFGVFDRESLTATERPVGWENSNFTPGESVPADGWDEFIGYYEGRRSVEGDPTGKFEQESA